MTTLVTEPDIRTSDTDPQTSEDKPNVAHYVMSPNDDETNHAYVMRARIEGFPVTALCGFTWIPHRQATGLPVCAECRDIWNELPDDGGGNPHE